MITALDVANYILEKAKEENISITPMKLQKLIYILYKEYLKETSKKLFEERFSVWKYGPVVESVYRAFSHYNSNPITEFYADSKGKYTTVKPNQIFKKVFEDIWSKHRYQDGLYLSELTHLPGTAWDKAHKSNRYTLETQDIFDEVTYD